jgi:hypothetical protein
MKTKIIQIALILIFCITSINVYGIGSTAAVIVAGAKIKSRKIDIEKKYPRSKCPICKGTGKVKEGDGVVEVEAECPYCEPDKKSGDTTPEKAMEHTPIILSPNTKEPEDKCQEGKCPIKPVPAKPTTIYRR